MVRHVAGALGSLHILVLARSGSDPEHDQGDPPGCRGSQQTVLAECERERCPETPLPHSLRSETQLPIRSIARILHGLRH